MFSNSDFDLPVDVSFLGKKEDEQEEKREEDISHEMQKVEELLKGFLEDKPTSGIFSKPVSLSSVSEIVPLGELHIPEDEMKSIVEEVVETKNRVFIREIEELIDKKVEKAIEKWLKKAFKGT
ncbi:MAG: hypothetical protein KAW82_01910 [Desulfurellaceae bacterium]|nr:hypothetical protein [Desulfurellaceae bacterium]